MGLECGGHEAPRIQFFASKRITVYLIRAFWPRCGCWHDSGGANHLTSREGQATFGREVNSSVLWNNLDKLSIAVLFGGCARFMIVLVLAGEWFSTNQKGIYYDLLMFMPVVHRSERCGQGCILLSYSNSGQEASFSGIYASFLNAENLTCHWSSSHERGGRSPFPLGGGPSQIKHGACKVPSISGRRRDRMSRQEIHENDDAMIPWLITDDIWMKVYNFHQQQWTWNTLKHSEA